MTCPCDFCTGRKRWADNWCPRCGEYKLEAPKWWENLDVCAECERYDEKARRAAFWRAFRDGLSFGPLWRWIRRLFARRSP